MPCENCTAQFTVFKRKKACFECRRLYCPSCLQKKKDIYVCGRCLIFTTRPLSKIDLLKLKAKDLIFYLQSKHISTTGCVEKEELVNLIIAHASANASGGNSARGSTTTGSNIFDENCANPFASIRQTCQTFFTGISDKIASDIQKATTPPTFAASNQQSNVFTQQPQPRSNRSNSNSSSVSSFASVNSKVPKTTTTSPTTANNQNLTSPVSSSTSSASSSARVARQSHPNLSKDNIPTVHSSDVKFKNYFPKLGASFNDDGCECCSDDELVQNRRPDVVVVHSEPSTSGTNGNNQNNNHKSDSSTTSSFEELGVSGGTAVSAQTTTDSDSWQIINQSNSSNNSLNMNATPAQQTQTLNVPSTNKSFSPQHNEPPPTTSSASDINSKNSFRKISRRRSDSSFVMKPGSRTTLNDSDNDDDDDNDGDILMQDDADELNRKRRKRTGEVDVTHKQCCEKCGKRKSGIKRSVARFRRQLEQSDSSEADKKQKLDEFLKYLEDRTKNSLDFSDTDDEVDQPSGVNNQQVAASDGAVPSTSQNVPDNDDDIYLLDENFGINVYASEEERPKRKFLQLDDIKASSDLDALSVKQLKETLVLNRVDFKGCCEKNELLERVKRLWNDHASLPSIEKMLPDDICKICMDAPIECILLECGHMACCTNCGKVLSECPICRQYIVRVVRFFRA